MDVSSRIRHRIMKYCLAIETYYDENTIPVEDDDHRAINTGRQHLYQFLNGLERAGTKDMRTKQN
jgi:hypothetical protein